MLLHSGDIGDQSLKWYKLDRNFACFWPQFFFLGGGGGTPPELLDLRYKIQPAFHHVTKFHDDQLRELRDPALKKKELEVLGRARCDM